MKRLALLAAALATAGLATNAQATIGYRAQVALPRPGARLIDRAELTDQFGRRVVAWAMLGVPAQLYLPLVRKEAP